ncbi:MAG: hypothetical protein LH615_03750 [Ferruginibacter sp.]|nr:hypothetical protein [Ferruginibacter sp.]
MSSITNELTALFNRIPRRHSTDNVKDIYNIITEYEDVLISIEAVNTFYEKNISTYFDDAENAKAAIKKSTDNKASKKNKDAFFDEGSGLLKESIQNVIEFFGDGKRINL